MFFFTVSGTTKKSKALFLKHMRLTSHEVQEANQIRITIMRKILF